MKFYIDAGAFDGVSIIKFYEGELLRLSDPSIEDGGYYAKDYFTFAFEPIYYPQWEYIKSKYPVQFIKKAIWIDDKGIEFNHHPKGFPSTLMEDKRDYNIGQRIVVPTIDFSKWLSKFNPENSGEIESIILKMDIEGAEYSVLDKMINDGTDKLIEKLYIEFHDDRLANDYSLMKKKIITHLGNKIVAVK